MISYHCGLRRKPIRTELTWKRQTLWGQEQVPGPFTLTKFTKIFMRNEMNDDLVLVPARLGQRDDDSEYEELLPVSPP